MTQLNDKERAAQMADMKSFDEEMPSIGIFWYDPNDHTLFGVGKKELTPQMVEEARAKGVEFIDYPKMHNIDCAQAYNGHVAWSVCKFVVHVGHWAVVVQDELKQLIEDTFHLPYFEFLYDESMEQQEQRQ